MTHSFPTLRSSELESFGSGSQKPFTVSFDRIESATEGVINGRRVILLGTNNYLGLTFDPHSIEEAVRAVQTLGTGTTGSRVANGSYAGHGALESDLAKFFRRRHCMVFSTGYQANLGRSEEHTSELQSQMRTSYADFCLKQKTKLF